MVYSTCSLSVKQNEDIVAAFLAEHPSAVLEPIARDGIPCEVRPRSNRPGCAWRPIIH